ncbi:MAG: hypothetical protein NZ473_06810, partial [Candidatus Kapabacteria bacterium]|nr:hypothetical protein [Candidatus Kapabacteria bacterium]MDW8225965.1 hypothetical protein [Bacteroidota bacterium]
TPRQIEIVFQVNGKVRAKAKLPMGTNEEELRRLALGHPHVQRFIAGQRIRQIVVVPNRLVNIVVE